MIFLKGERDFGCSDSEMPPPCKTSIGVCSARLGQIWKRREGIKTTAGGASQGKSSSKKGESRGLLGN